MVSIIVTCSLLTFFFQYSSQEKPYDFRPESRQIFVNEGESTHYVGFEEFGNRTTFGYCYIQSDSINIDYPIWKEETNETEEVQTYSFREFSPYNNTHSCAFVYENVDDKMPLKWTVTAYDNQTKNNFTEEVTVTYYYNMPVYLEQLVGLERSSLANFYIAGSTKLKKCTLSFDNASVELDMNTIKVYNDDNVFKSRLTSLGGGKCGYKINNVALTDPTSLILYATDDKNKNYRHTSQLVVETLDEKLQNRTTVVHIGDDKAFVICGKETDSSANNDQKFCHLYNPQGILVSHGHMCQYQLDIVTMDDIGTWRCSVGYDHIMETLDFTTDLVAGNSEFVTTFTKNTTDFYIIGCQLVNYTSSSLSYCKFTRPDGHIFKVTAGEATVNYNTFSTDLQNGKCSLEMLKPLRAEDKGTWKCETVFDSLGETSGAFITVESSKVFSYNKKMEYNVHLGNSFTVDCMVPYSSDHCYIVAPNRTSYDPDNRLEITTGLCSFKVDHATVSDNGTWKCSMAQENGIPDEIITVDISIIDLKVLFSDVEVAENENAELFCNTNGIPLDYCRFVSPSGLSYSLRKENTAATNKYSYSGRGFDYGDCGMKITNAERTDGGQWYCHISSKRTDTHKKPDITKSIKVNIIPPRSPINIADSLGIAVGVVAAILIVGGFLFYKYARRSGENIEATVHHSERDGSETSESDSSESVILAVGQSTTYNNQEPLH